MTVTANTIGGKEIQRGGEATDGGRAALNPSEESRSKFVTTQGLCSVPSCLPNAYLPLRYHLLTSRLLLKCEAAMVHVVCTKQCRSKLFWFSY